MGGAAQNQAPIPRELLEQLQQKIEELERELEEAAESEKLAALLRLEAAVDRLTDVLLAKMTAAAE
jgi:hypothetical protein